MADDDLGTDETEDTEDAEPRLDVSKSTESLLLSRRFRRLDTGDDSRLPLASALLPLWLALYESKWRNLAAGDELLESVGVIRPCRTGEERERLVLILITCCGFSIDLPLGIQR